MRSRIHEAGGARSGGVREGRLSIVVPERVVEPDAAGARADDGGPPISRAVGRARRLVMLRVVALAKRKLIRWLLVHDFEELPRRATSHRRFRGAGTTITVPAHGRPELSAKHTGMLIRELEKAGFDRDQIRNELGA